MKIRRRQFVTVTCLSPAWLLLVGCSPGTSSEEEAKKQTEALSNVLQQGGAKNTKTGKPAK